MSNLLDTAQAWLHDQLQTHAGRAVTYARGEASVSLTAVPDGREPEVMLPSEGGTAVNAKQRQWLITASDLLLSGSEAAPAEGDEIRETSGDDVLVWRLLKPSADEPIWRWSGTGQQTYRVHTRLVETE